MPLDTLLFAAAEDGREEAAYAGLKAALGDCPQYTVRDQTDYEAALQDQIGQLLNMVHGLLAPAIVVAALGVVNTLAPSVVERTREIGLLRAVGLSRRQLRRMIRLESVVIALFGALLGLGLGLGMGWGGARRSGCWRWRGRRSWRSLGRRSAGCSWGRRSWGCPPPWCRRSGRGG
ncbi:hypothetical protein GCM10010145_36660 [Streptomyces ruber]|uniref:ABC3 transporter permease C-terminal domain-containing protein n=2 Tax=Streptomyces TaxID=1883 RepID=A0A918BER7_9ACTN|nr:hypothetical protein GCM10010145_36660 [Streptomyces ruber]